MKNSIIISTLTALLQSFIIAYTTFTPQPNSWGELSEFKFVMVIIITLSTNLGLAHTNFRSDNSRTRVGEKDAKKVDILDVLKSNNDFKE